MSDAEVIETLRAQLLIATEDRDRMASIMLDIAYGRHDVSGDTPEYLCWHNLPDHYTNSKKWPEGVKR